MKLEDIKYDFPNMPENMRQMIEQEVERQLAKPENYPPYSEEAIGRSRGSRHTGAWNHRMRGRSLRPEK